MLLHVCSCFSTTIDAESEASDRSDKDYGVTTSKKNRDRIIPTHVPKRPNIRHQPSSTTTTTSTSSTSTAAPATIATRPTVITRRTTTEASIIHETRTDPVTIDGNFDDSLHNFFAPDYGPDDYETGPGKGHSPQDTLDRDQSASEHRDKKIIHADDGDDGESSSSRPSARGDEETSSGNGKRNHPIIVPEDHDGLPGFPPPTGFVIPLESEGQNVELTADGAGFVLDDGRGEIESRIRQPYENESKQPSLDHDPQDPKLLRARPPHLLHPQLQQHAPHDAYSGAQEFDQQQEVRVIAVPSSVPVIASTAADAAAADILQQQLPPPPTPQQPVIHVPVSSSEHQGHHHRKKHHHHHHLNQQVHQQQQQQVQSGLRPQQSNLLSHVIQAANPVNHHQRNNAAGLSVIIHPNQQQQQQVQPDQQVMQQSQQVQPLLAHAPLVTVADAQQHQQQHVIPVFVDQNTQTMPQNVAVRGNIPMGMPMAGILMQQRKQSLAQRLAEKMLQHTFTPRRSQPEQQYPMISVLNQRAKREAQAVESNAIHEDKRLVDLDHEAAASRFYSMDDFDPPHHAALPHPGHLAHPLLVDSFPHSTHVGGDLGSSSNNRRRSSGRHARHRDGSGSGRRLSQEAESHHKKTFGILGSGNFEVIRGGIYREETDTGNEGGRPHHGGHSDKGVHEDYDDASTGHRKYTFAPMGSHDEESSLFGGRDPVMGFQGFDNFHLASNQEEDLKKMDDSEVTRVSASRHQPVFVDSDQDLMAIA